MRTRIVFSAKDFRTLVEGGIVDKEGVEIVMSDTGFGQMHQILEETTARRTSQAMTSKETKDFLVRQHRRGLL